MQAVRNTEGGWGVIYICAGANRHKRERKKKREREREKEGGIIMEAFGKQLNTSKEWGYAALVNANTRRVDFD